jgi:hypothetical protein
MTVAPPCEAKPIKEGGIPWAFSEPIHPNEFAPYFIAKTAACPILIVG